MASREGWRSIAPTVTAQGPRTRGRRGPSRCSTADLLPYFWNAQCAADLASESVRDLGVPRHRFRVSCPWVGPQRVACSLTLEVTPMLPQVAEQVATLHLTVTVSRTAFGGRPRRPSSRRSSRISEIAEDRFSRASSLLLPCPFAPGISGAYAMNHSPSRSMTAVNWFAMPLVSRFPEGLSNTPRSPARAAVPGRRGPCQVHLVVLRRILDARGLLFVGPGADDSRH